MEQLKKVHLFSNLSEDELQNVFSRGITKHFRKNEFIVSQGEKGDAMYLIMHGSVKLTLFNEVGKTIVLSTLNEGDFFGELSLLDEKSRSCTVIAASDCELFILTRTLFFSLIKDYPAVVSNVLKELTLRLRKADSRIGSLALSDVYRRTIQVLYDIADDVGETTEEGYFINRLPTHEELANTIGATRESVSRVMANIKKTGLIKIFKDRKVLLRKRIM